MLKRGPASDCAGFAWSTCTARAVAAHNAADAPRMLRTYFSPQDAQSTSAAAIHIADDALDSPSSVSTACHALSPPPGPPPSPSAAASARTSRSSQSTCPPPLPPASATVPASGPCSASMRRRSLNRSPRCRRCSSSKTHVPLHTPVCNLCILNS